MYDEIDALRSLKYLFYKYICMHAEFTILFKNLG